jgi:DNA-binding transcriptional LysR family regulator
MNILQLQCFLSAASYANFYEAADAIHLSESALSKNIKALEKELGTSLFDRTGRHAVINSTGKEVLTYARAILTDYEKMRQAALPDTSSLSIGLLPVQAQYHLPAFFQAVTKQCHLHLIKEEVEDEALLDGLAHHRYDAIITRCPDHLPSSYMHVKIADDELTAVMSAHHPLAGQSRIFLSDLDQKEIILMNPNTSVYQLCMKLFQKNHVHPVVVETGQPASLLASLPVAEVIALLPSHSADLFPHEDIVSRPLSPSVPISLEIICPRRHNAPTEAFLSAARKWHG